MKKICFSDRFGLTEAVLSGRKTMTRRIAYEFGYRVDKCKIWGNNITYMDGKMQVLDEFPNPRYKVGEVVAIAQAYKDFMEADKVLYRTVKEVDGYRRELASEQKGWNNKLFVCANLMPHHIRITDVKVERLQEISDEDCIKEGIDKWTAQRKRYYGFFDNVRDIFSRHKTPRDAYAALIDRISGKGTWQSNPYVFVYEFELID